MGERHSASWKQVTRGAIIVPLSVFLFLSAFFLVYADTELLRAHLAGGSATSEQQVMHAETLAYLDGKRADLSFYTRSEQEHLRDVRRLLNIARGVLVVSGLIILWFVLRIRKAREAGRKELSTLLRRTGLAVLVIALMLGLGGLNFPWFWLRFHELFFPQGNYLFSVTSVLITLYPESFWSTLAMHVLAAALSLGLLCLLGALLLEPPKPAHDTFAHKSARATFK
ncbi:DUF1461 domain-containing protein [Candidatus Woesearchaeota archaeon]|nr:MAG: DUF1461 domain-containing protein [Candidatus Woesearchaeota archaeon]